MSHGGLESREGKFGIKEVYVCDCGAFKPIFWDYMEQGLGSDVRMTRVCWKELVVGGQAKR